MKKQLNIGVIGGGSIFTPELVELLAKYTDIIGPLKIKLMDIDKPRLTTVGELCRRIIQKKQKPVEVVYANDYKEAIEESDFVLIQFRVGCEDARISDDKIGMKHKIPFVETVTVCGLASFLRTYYQMEIIAELVQKYSPTAWVMNFSNPSGALSEALYRLGCKKVLGVCNGPTGYLEHLAEKLNADPKDMFFNWRGLNHLTFIDGIFCRNENVFQRFVDEMPEEGTFSKALIKSLGYFPNSYVQYIYNKEITVKKLQAEKETRAEAVKKVNAEILALYERIDYLPENLKDRGGFGYSRSVADLIKSLITNDMAIHYPSIKNGSVFPELPEDAFIEVPAVAVMNDVHALQIEPLPGTAKALVYTMKQYERALFEAALNRDKNKLLNAMLINPLFGSEHLSRAVLGDVLEANAEYLPI
jgi:6-phospho-beta-glucosidase